MGTGTATGTGATTASSPRRADLLVALGCGLSAIAAYLAFRHGGRHQWDALMTGSVLARPEWASTRDWLFFAHPLVIPLTAPFAWLLGDPLLAAGAREALFGGVVVALAFLAVRAVTGRRGPALIAAAGLALASSRWRLATLGEEKEVALAFAGAFVLLYLDHRALLDLGLGWARLTPITRRLLLGALLAAACAVHLVNGVLVLILLADTALDRAAARDAGAVLGVAALLAGPFFLWLAIGPGGARGPAEIARFFLEYHASGEFVTVPGSIVERAVDAWLGARRYLLGDLPAPWAGTEAIAACLAGAAIVAFAARRSPRLTALLGVWLGALALHFFFYEPWDPEAWAPAALAWLLLGALALGRRLVLVAPLLLALAALDGREWIVSRREPSPVRAVRALDARLPRDALILVDDRHDASYFHIYTARSPVVRPYLGMTDAQLRGEQLFSTLSMAYYRPRMTVAEVEAACREGRCVEARF
jgi:hypothetical protein